MEVLSAQKKLDDGVKKGRWWSVIITAIISSGPALLIGVTLGFPSVLLVDVDLNNTQSDIFGALAPIGAMLGSFIAGFITSVLGRKGSLLLVMVPYFIGYLTLSYTQFITDQSVLLAILYVGRFFTGIGLGWCSSIVPVYHAEISVTKVRGLISSFTQLFLSVGLFVVYSLGTIPGLRYYQTSLIISGIIAGLAVLLLLVPESPRWLLTQGKVDNAVKVLKYLRGNAPINCEVEAVQQDIANAPKENVFILLKYHLCSPKRLKPIAIVLVVVFLLQMSGLNAGSAYASVIFQEAGVKDASRMASFVVGGTSIVFTLISVFLVDYFGRKFLLVLSGTGMVVGTVMLGTHFYVTRSSLCMNMTTQDTTDAVCNSHYGPLAITGLLLFNATFSIGWGPVPWILLGELIPLNIRGAGSSLATFVSWGTAAIVTGFYFNYSELVNTWFAWWTFSIFNCLGIAFVLIFVKETKGRSLEQLSQQEYN